MITKLDHISIVVKDIDAAAKAYEEMFGFKMESKREFPGGDRLFAYLKLGDITLELFQPVKPGTELAKFLEEKGGGIQHIAFTTDNIVKDIKRIKAGGRKMVHNEPIAGPGFKVAFVDPSAGENVSIELVQRGEGK